MIFDLYIIFYESLFPWDDPKYIKRINRLLLLCVSQYITENKNIDKLSLVIKNNLDIFTELKKEKFIDNKINIILKYYNINIVDFKSNIQDLQYISSENKNIKSIFETLINIYLRTLIFLNFIMYGKSDRYSHLIKLNFYYYKIRFVKNDDSNKYHFIIPKLEDQVISIRGNIPADLSNKIKNDTYHMGFNIQKTEIIDPILEQKNINNLNDFENTVINKLETYYTISKNISKYVDIDYSGSFA